MRSLGLFACCSALIACGDGNGADVVIVVHAPPDVDVQVVQLVAGMLVDGADTSITPDGAPEQHGAVAVIKPLTLSSPIGPGQTVELSIDLGDLDHIDVVAALAGLGTSAVETPTATAFRYGIVKLPGDDYTKYALELAPLVPANDAGQTSNQVLRWGPKDGAADERCVYLRNDATDFFPAGVAQIDINGDGNLDEADDDLARGLFLVRHADDVDCDGYPEGEKECAPDVYLSAQTPELDELDCLWRDDSGAGGACRVGGPGCIDGVDDDSGACAPSRYCATTQLCACKSAMNVPNCVRDLVQQNQGTLSGYYLDCKIYVPYVMPGVPTPVCTMPTTVSLPIGACESEILGATRNGSFGDKLEWDEQRVKLETTVSPDGCSLELTPSGNVAILSEPPMPVVHGAVLVVPLTNGSGLALPVRFSFEPEIDTMSTPCENANYRTTCMLVGSPDGTLAQCLAAPP